MNILTDEERSQLVGNRADRGDAERLVRDTEAAVLAKFGEPVATYEGHFKTLDAGIVKEHCSIPEGTPLYAIKKEGA